MQERENARRDRANRVSGSWDATTNWFSPSFLLSRYCPDIDRTPAQVLCLACILASSVEADDICSLAIYWMEARKL